MATKATVCKAQLQLCDFNRDYFGAHSLTIAQHPSETDRFLIARLLVRCLEHAEGLDFGPGLSDGDTPALWRHDLRGDVTDWIEVGHPAAERLHKASKATGRVAVYAWRTPERIVDEIAAGKVHRAEAIELFALDVGLLDDLVGDLGRTHAWAISVSGGEIYVDVGGATRSGAVRRLPIG